MALQFEPMVYGNVKGYFRAGRYVVAKTKFGWVAWVDFGEACQTLLSTNASANTRAGAEADCNSHAAKVLA